MECLHDGRKRDMREIHARLQIHNTYSGHLGLLSKWPVRMTLADLHAGQSETSSLRVKDS